VFPHAFVVAGETGVSGENHRSVASHWQTLSHNVVSSTPHNERTSSSMEFVFRSFAITSYDKRFKEMGARVCLRFAVISYIVSSWNM
jgi:hypothetical protein